MYVLSVIQAAEKKKEKIKTDHPDVPSVFICEYRPNIEADLNVLYLI